MASVQDLLKNILAELKKISSKVNDLENRVSRLEGSPQAHMSVDPDTGVLRSSSPAYIPPHPATASEKTDEKKPKEKKDFELEVGVGWLGKIGIVAIAIAMAYFLRYSIDNSLFGISFGPVGRISIGFIVGIAMLGFGEYFHSRFPQWSKEFTGGGLGLLYFAIFTASNFDRLIPFSAGLVIMSIITAAAGWFSIRYNARIIAIFGLLGGYLTPYVIGYQTPNYNRMLFYVLVLNIGVAFFAYFRRWRALNVIALIITGIYTASAFLHLSFSLSLLYILIFFVLFIAHAVTYNLVNREITSQEDLFVLIVNPLMTLGFVYTLFHKFNYDNFLALVSLLFAAVYLVLAYGAQMVNKKDKYLAFVFVGLTAGFIALAIPLKLDTYWITIAWAVQFIAMLWIGLQLRQIGTRIYALIVGILVLLRLVFFDISETVYEYRAAFFNPRMGSSLFVIALIYLGAYLYKFYRTRLKENEHALASALAIIANITTLFLFSYEIHTYFALKQNLLATQGTQLYKARRLINQQSQILISAFWLLYATVLIAIGTMKKYRSIRLLALVLFFISILKIVIYDLSGFEPIYRIIAFVILGVLLIASSYMYMKNKEKILEFIVEPKENEQDVTETIYAMDDQGKSMVVFSLLDGKRFKVTNPNIVKICIAISSQFGKTNFTANELLETYNFYEKNFRSQLNPEDVKTLKKYLLEFATTGGSFEIS